MTERFGIEPSEYDSEALREVMSQVDSLPTFLALLHDQLPSVPVQPFLYDFGAQVDLLALMEQYAHATRTDREIPVVVLKTPGETEAGRETIGGTAAVEPYRFHLLDPQHTYFFNQVPPQNAHQVRFVDTNTGAFSEPQTISPINRVPRAGGVAMRYDYKKHLWEPSGQGVVRQEGVGNERMTDGTSNINLPRIYSRK